MLIYKQANVSTDDIVSIIDGLSTKNLNATEQALLNNRTTALAAIPISHANVSAMITPPNGGSAQQIMLTTADDVGEIDQFVPVPNLADNKTAVQVVQLAISNVSGALTFYSLRMIDLLIFVVVYLGPGNGTAILVPSSGYSIVSDIDDVLRITKVYVPNEGLFNSFVEPYVNVPGMPELFANWAKKLTGVSFHYDTTTPVQLTRTYVEYLFNEYPIGSLDMRPINISEPSVILEARQVSLVKLFQTFPSRKFGTCLLLCAAKYVLIPSSFSPRRGYVLLNPTQGLPGYRVDVPGANRVYLHQEHVCHGSR